jgi:hypothetical protein
LGGGVGAPSLAPPGTGFYRRQTDCETQLVDSGTALPNNEHELVPRT